MARLLGPDAGSRYAEREDGSPAVNATAVVWANSGATVLADIRAYDGSETPAGAILGSQVAYDDRGFSELYWFPDGADRVWVSVDGGPVWPVDADNNRRIDTIVGRAEAQIRYVAPGGDDSLPGLVPSLPKATLAAALAALPGGVGVVQMLPGTYAMGAGDSFVIDVSKVSVRCADQAVLSWSAAPAAGYAVRLFSSADFAGRVGNWRTALDGIVLRGNLYASLAAVGIVVGSTNPAYTEHSCFSIENGGVEGFTTGIRFDNNSWKVAVRKVHIRGDNCSAIVQPAGTVNSGEAMTFHDCMFEGRPGIKLYTGDWHFFGCSFDTMTVTADGDCGVFLHGCHLENPGDATTGYRMLQVLNASGNNGAAIVADGCMVIIGNHGSNFTRSPFYVADACTTGGLTVRDSHLPQAGYITPEVTDALPFWVAGNGRAVASGVWGFESFSGFPFSRWQNLIFNPDAEGGTTAGWTGAGTGTFVTSTTAGDRQSGTRGFKVSVSSGQSYTAYTEVPVRPGDKLNINHWFKTTKTGDGQIITGVAFYAWVGGPQVGSMLAFDNVGSTGGGVRKIGDVVPAKVTVARLLFTVSSASSGTAVMVWDNAYATAT
ncbi:hypothetical protein OG423_14095 [Micromonospora zamorensis]|uniref:hypothetical protein n=1 Tax=Micromonospora zamorensis TaxID=709883 RepID=UPI00352AAF5B|nr:hypothetical protein OG423_14095 [Micromonospora zamorensis]